MRRRERETELMGTLPPPQPMREAFEGHWPLICELADCHRQMQYRIRMAAVTYYVCLPCASAPFFDAAGRADRDLLVMEHV